MTIFSSAFLQLCVSFFSLENRSWKMKLILPAQPILPLRDPAYPVFNFNKRVSWLTSGTGYAGSRSGRIGCAGKMDCVWLGFFPVFEFCYLEDAKTQRHREFRRGLG